MRPVLGLTRSELRELPTVGFFAGGYPDEPGLPRAEALVDTEWAENERGAVLTHLGQGTVAFSYRGMSHCRICGCLNGSQELTDGAYLWPSGFAHYVEAHSVRPPQAFVAHVLASR